MILLIGNHKGGVGKSTLTINLAVHFQQTGLKVTIVEADPSIKTSSRWADDREELKEHSITTVRKDGRLAGTLKDLATSNDVVLVDTAGKDSKELRSAMTVADLLLIPARPAQADLDATADLVDMIDAALDLNPDLQVLAVLSQASTHPMSNDVTEAQAYLREVAPEISLSDTVIYQRKAYQVALSSGLSVVETTDRKAKAEIQLLAQELLTLLRK